MPPLRQVPGALLVTSGCMGHTYDDAEGRGIAGP